MIPTDSTSYRPTASPTSSPSPAFSPAPPKGCLNAPRHIPARSLPPNVGSSASGSTIRSMQRWSAAQTSSQERSDRKRHEIKSHTTTGESRAAALNAAGEPARVPWSHHRADCPNPLWYRNLPANPEVTVQLRRDIRRMRARTADPAERTELRRADGHHQSGHPVGCLACLAGLPGPVEKRASRACGRRGNCGTRSSRSGPNRVLRSRRLPG